MSANCPEPRDDAFDRATFFSRSGAAVLGAAIASEAFVWQPQRALAAAETAEEPSEVGHARCSFIRGLYEGRSTFLSMNRKSFHRPDQSQVFELVAPYIRAKGRRDSPRDKCLLAFLERDCLREPRDKCLWIENHSNVPTVPNSRVGGLVSPGEWPSWISIGKKKILIGKKKVMFLRRAITQRYPGSTRNKVDSVHRRHGIAKSA